MYILGLGQIGGEDSSAALLKNGIVVGAVAEERISRIKHQGGVSKTGRRMVPARSRNYNGAG